MRVQRHRFEVGSILGEWNSLQDTAVFLAVVKHLETNPDHAWATQRYPSDSERHIAVRLEQWHHEQNYQKGKKRWDAHNLCLLYNGNKRYYDLTRDMEWHDLFVMERKLNHQRKLMLLPWKITK